MIVKTDVTTALIDKMARENSITCIGDLLVGFKYVAEEMNTAGVRRPRVGLHLRLRGKPRLPHRDLCPRQGCGRRRGVDRRVCGRAEAAGPDPGGRPRRDLRRLRLLPQLPDRDPAARAPRAWSRSRPSWTTSAAGPWSASAISPWPRRSTAGRARPSRTSPRPTPPPATSSSSASDNVPETTGLRVTVRPSGTEPKIKMYFELVGKPCRPADLAAAKQALVDVRQRLEKTFMRYCYGLIGVDFPERGFLLFWQLPLKDKLRYFEIEDEIARLKDIPERSTRVEKLDSLLKFLGANPVQKVDNAFKARFGRASRTTWT
ncbi:MAG: hypothetical protein MZU95_03465 [Desulfomicrobium escambiense]|nr:hypothetical protein [Desulfomicrobium escambiense]